MALSNRLMILFLFLNFIPVIGMAQRRSTLPTLSTKQAISNLRFVSQDGKFTYYQRRSGTLLLSSNYKVVEILQGNPGTNYTLSATTARKKILIVQNAHFHDYLSVRQGDKIYTVNYGEETPQFIAEGVDPKLHLNDEWISYFSAKSRELNLQNISNSVLSFQLKLNNIRNPYFQPFVAMIDSGTVLYTDLNEIGITGLLLFNRKENKSSLIAKVDRADQVFDFCLNDKFLYRLERGINDSTFGTRLHQYPRTDFKLENGVLLYQSSFNDLGQLDCHAQADKVYFIKNTTDKADDGRYEVASLTLSSKKVDVLSDLNFATQMINLDGRILIPYRGQYYVIIGDSDLTEEDRLSPKEGSAQPLPPPPSEATP